MKHRNRESMDRIVDFVNDIVMAFVKGRGNTLKRFRQDEHGAWLHSENPKYADIPLTKCKVQGVVISVTKAL